ncbi:MAG: hypothetical protein AB8F94_06105 [Saprospiraceae bacterium]
MKTLIYSISLLFLLSSCNDKNISFPLFKENFTDSRKEQMVIDSLSRVTILGMNYGYRYKKRPDLRKKLSHQTILKISKSIYPYLRMHAYLALSLNEDFIYSNTFQKLLKDYSKTVTVSRCLVMPTQINRDVLNLWIHENEGDKIKNRFVDSVIIYSNNPVVFRNNRLYSLVPYEGFYPRVKELSLRKNSSSAHIALAKYQKEEDVPILLSYFKSSDSKYHIPQIAKYFPHKDFFPFLVEMYKESKKTNFIKRPLWLFEAIWKYDSKLNASIFEDIFNSDTQRANLRLWSILEKSKNKNDDVFLKMFQKKYGHKTINEFNTVRFIALEKKRKEEAEKKERHLEKDKIKMSPNKMLIEFLYR